MQRGDGKPRGRGGDGANGAGRLSPQGVHEYRRNVSDLHTMTPNRGHSRQPESEQVSAGPNKNQEDLALQVLNDDSMPDFLSDDFSGA